MTPKESWAVGTVGLRWEYMSLGVGWGGVGCGGVSGGYC